MTDSMGLDRRAFLRGAGIAVAGAVTTAGSVAANAGETGPRPMNGSKYDLDEIYDVIADEMINGGNFDVVIERGRVTLEYDVTVAPPT